jgi:dihydrofolate synthase/folylpolyglutamate synthase
LGGSIGSIAAEKAGVIKAGRPLVAAPQSREAMTILRERCAALASPLYEGGRDFDASWKGGGLDYRGILWELGGLSPGIPGRYQAMNAAAALCAAELLGTSGLPVTAVAARRGIEAASWPGRMEMFPGPPRVLLDGAHNPGGAEALAESLADIPRDALILVAGMVGDKDADGILAPLLPLADRIMAVAPAIPRGLPSRELVGRCRTLGYQALDAGGVVNGLETAITEAQPGDLILVCGSLFTVGEARARLLNKKFEPFRG